MTTTVTTATHVAVTPSKVTTVGSDGGDNGEGDGNLRVVGVPDGTIQHEEQLNGKATAIVLSNGMVWVTDVDADSLLGLVPAALGS